MTITRIALVTLCLTAGASGVCAQPAVIVPQGQPLESPPIAYPQGPCAPSKCHADLDPTCMPDCYGYNRLAIPYELSFRTGPSFIIGGNRFDSVLNTGIFNEIAAKGFCYSADHSRAWTLTLGLADLYNTSDESVSVIQRVNDVAMIDFSGNPDADLTIISDYGIEYLHRQYVSLAAGHEWYKFSSDPCGLRFNCGLEGGGRIGHAHAQLNAVNRLFIGTPGQFDTFRDIPEFHVTDRIEGIFASFHAGMFYSRWGYDIYLGIRGELSRDWLDIVDGDRTIDQANFLFEIGCRY